MAAVTVSYEPDYITVSVTDVGHGPVPVPVAVAVGQQSDPAAAAARNEGNGSSAPAIASGGLGLAGIAERVASCGGSFTVGPGQAVRAAAKHAPDVVLTDVRMPEMDGLEATRQITGGDRPAAPRVVMLTTFDLDDYVYEALRAGASGLLLKDAPRHDLIAAIKTAASGNTLLAPSVTVRLIDAFARRPAQTPPTPSRLASLTAREHEILLAYETGIVRPGDPDAG